MRCACTQPAAARACVSERGRVTRGAARSLAHLRAATGYHVETYVTMLDLNGMGYNAFNSDARAFLSLVASLSSDNYPETNGGMIVLNPPWWFSMAWSVVKRFLDARTQRKVRHTRAAPSPTPHLLSPPPDS